MVLPLFITLMQKLKPTPVNSVHLYSLIDILTSCGVQVDFIYTMTRW